MGYRGIRWFRSPGTIIIFPDSEYCWMTSVLFVCTYNSVRSQLAEGVCRRLHPNWDIASAGIGKAALSPHVVRVLEEEGVDCFSMYAKLLCELPMRTYDVLVVLCENAWQARTAFPPAAEVIYHPVRSPDLWIGEDELSDYRRLREELKEWMIQELHF